MVEEEILVSETKSSGKKALEKPKETVKQKQVRSKAKNVREQKIKDAGSKTAPDEEKQSEEIKDGSTTDRKRKRMADEQSEDGTEQNTEVNTNEDKIAENSKNSNVDAETTKKKKVDTDEKSENLSHKMPEATSSQVKPKTPKKDIKKTSANSKEKNVGHPPISDMVMASIRNLRKRSGTSVEDICKWIDENYVVNITRIKHWIIKFLQKGVADGTFDQVSGNGADGKFQINKTEKNKGTGKIVKSKAKVKAPAQSKKDAEKKKKSAGRTQKGRETSKVAKKNSSSTLNVSYFV